MPTAAVKHRNRGQTFLVRQQTSVRAQLFNRKLYNTSAYQTFRAWLLGERPLCQDCEDNDMLTPAKEVHHVRKLILHPEDLCDAKHCRVLCKPCHQLRTSRGE